MMKENFLLEIGCEELPAKALPKLAQSLLDGIRAGLNDAELIYTDAKWLASPRRLAVYITDLQTQQPEQHIERKGPPLKAAYDKDGQATKALSGFLDSCGAQRSELSELETPKGVWLMYKGVKPGQATADLLPGIVETTIKKLPIPKPMRWGNGKTEFIRPVHWLVMMLGKAFVPANILGQQADRVTYGHRFMAPKALKLKQASDYVSTLENKGKVIVDFEQRKRIIRELSEKSAKKVHGKAVIDDALLNEVCGLVEWPVPMLANFDRSFLKVPAEALIASMEEHQKCFAVIDDYGKLMPHFIAISNIASKQPMKVIKGNEKVMNARLSDAKFFYELDNKHRLDSRLEALNSVVFQKQLGTLHDKANRISQLASSIAEALNADTAQAARSGLLAKADLMSEMVGEFPALQGIMGCYYAKHDGEGDTVANAIREHYQPKFAGDDLPNSQESCAVALADKLDTLVGIFGINQAPTGDKDPFALRRAAIGVFRIITEKQLSLNLTPLVNLAADLYGDKLSNDNLVTDVINFIFERMRAYYKEQNVAHGVFEAVLAKRPTKLLDFQARIDAVLKFNQLPEAKALAEANKRVRNILTKNADKGLTGDVQINLLEDVAEKELAQHLQQSQAEVKRLCDTGDYSSALFRLAELRQPIEAFFADVMVMADNPALRNNRLLLLNQLRELFLQIADISVLS
tara:strand:+ start:11014 stop:13086 length:2073 start_codon:yes stop_codon:yes gene_type:complete